MGNFNVMRVNEYPDGISRSHFFRYHAASGYIDPGDIVVDAACGSGAGVELMCRYAGKVIGLDRDPEAIKYAMEHHKKENNYFMQVNFDQMDSFPECDVATTIETIEHLRYPAAFAAKIKQSTRKKIFLTTPIIPTKHEDSTHLQDFTEQDICDLFVDSNWGCVDSALQGPYLLISFFRK